MRKYFHIYFDKNVARKLGEDNLRHLFKRIQFFLSNLPDEEIEEIRRAGSPDAMTWLILLKFYRSFKNTFSLLNELASEPVPDTPAPKVQEKKRRRKKKRKERKKSLLTYLKNRFTFLKKSKISS